MLIKMQIPFRAIRVYSFTASKFIHEKKPWHLKKNQNKTLASKCTLKSRFVLTLVTITIVIVLMTTEVRSPGNVFFGHHVRKWHISSMSQNVSGSLHVYQNEQKIILMMGNAALSVNPSSNISLRQLKTTVIRL